MKITRVYEKGGRFYYLQDLAERNPKTGRPLQKWHALTRVDEGQAALHEALAKLLGQAPAPGGNMPGFIAEYTRSALKELAFDVRREYERMFTVMAKAFARFDVTDVEPGTVLQFLSDNFPGKLNTQGKYKARLSSFFSWCVLHQTRTGVQINPCRELRLKAPPKRRGRLNGELYWAIHEALTPMGRCFLRLTFLTRQRPTEIRLLRESHIGPTHIRFEPGKTKHSSAEFVEILITPEIRSVIEQARALRPRGKITQLDKHRDPYIIQQHDGTCYSKNGLYEIWRDAVEKVGCKGITTRDIRPYALSEMERQGAEPRDIQRSAAHAIMSTTEGYLEQYRQRMSDFRLAEPAPKPAKT